MLDAAQTTRAQRLTSSVQPHRAAAEGLGRFGWAFGLSGVSFVLYPALRPFSTEAGLDGAGAFGSSSWVLAHTLGIFGFILLGLGGLGMYLRLHGTVAERRVAGCWWLGWSLIARPARPDVSGSTPR